MSNLCEICGKPQSPYPNWIVSKGHQMHVGCMADQFEELRQTVALLLDKHIVGGNYGPFSDDWTGSFCEKHWGEIDLWRKEESAK